MAVLAFNALYASQPFKSAGRHFASFPREHPEACPGSEVCLQTFESSLPFLSRETRSEYSSLRHGSRGSQYRHNLASSRGRQRPPLQARQARSAPGECELRLPGLAEPAPCTYRVASLQAEPQSGESPNLIHLPPLSIPAEIGGGVPSQVTARPTEPTLGRSR